MTQTGRGDEAMTNVLAFDVNETLLDLGALDPLFTELLGDARLRPAWFGTVLQLSFVGGLTGQYVDSTTAQRAALQMTAARASHEISTASVETIIDAMRRLPAHPDVVPALTRLREAGGRLIALTNSAPDVAQAQLTNAGLAELFEEICSADEVRALKPFAAPYLMVADRCGGRYWRVVSGGRSCLGRHRRDGGRCASRVHRARVARCQARWAPSPS